MIVMKFGGTSLKDAKMFKKSAEIVLAEPREKIVVVSACAGITDQLISLAQKAAKRDSAWSTGAGHLQGFYEGLLESLFPSGSRERRIVPKFKDYIRDLEKLLVSVMILQELTPRALDTIMALGEFLSTLIFSALLRELTNKDGASRPVSPGKIRTNSNFGNAEIDLAATKKTLFYLKDRLKKKIIPVIPGFVGKTRGGAYTTLGRNGSDYTAAAIASIFDAEELQIWKEVDGVMRADPKLIPEAKVLNEISYEEAMEMTYFGSKVLHPKSILPAIQKKIPIRIKDTYNPDSSGTLISSETSISPKGVKVITNISDLALINVVGKGMVGVAGIAARVFGATAKADVNVMMISQASSEYSICFVVKQNEAKKAADAVKKEFELEFHHGMLEKVEVDSKMSIIAIVGDGMLGKIGIAAKFFTALTEADVNIISIAQGSSERNISVLVKSEGTQKAVRSVYNKFFGKGEKG